MDDTRPAELVLVAGATGSLGRHVVAVLRERGVRVRILSRRVQGAQRDEGIEAACGDVLAPETLAGCLTGLDAVISCVGASLDLYAVKDRLSYSRVDAGGNLALIRAAAAAAVPRFTYVSVFSGPGIEQTAYVRAHREVDRALAASGFDYRIVRPTGFFAFLDELIRMARRGFVPIVGDGSARTNPIDERDLAAIVAGAFDEPDRIIDAGGPEVFSRREMAMLAAAATGRPARVVSSPPWAWRLASRALAPAQPRISELLEFAAAVSTSTIIAPARGRRRLEDHFREALEQMS